MKAIDFKFVDHKEPHHQLKPYVKFYSYIKFETTPSPLWIPADRRNQMLFLKKGDVELLCDGLQYKQSSISLRPVFNKPLTVHFLSHEVEVINIEFTPIGLYKLFKIEISSLTNQINSTQNLFPDNFLDQLNGNNFHEIFDDYLLSLLKNDTQNDAGLTIMNAIRRVEKEKGKLEVKDIPNLLNIHPKKFYRDFKKYTGLSPKQYFRIIQFESTLLEILNNQEVDKMELINQAGFYDQAHFIKTIQKFTGSSPEKIKQLDQNWLQFLIQNDMY